MRKLFSALPDRYRRTRGGALPWILVGLGCLALVVILGLIVFAFGFLVILQPGAPDPRPASPVAAPVASTDLASYTGNWLSHDSTPGEEHMIVLRIENGRIVGTVFEEEGRLELMPGTDGKLHGTAFAPGEDPMPLMAELTEDHETLVMTALPPASEPIVQSFMRVRTD